MVMLKSCQYCFKVHPLGVECPRKPKKDYSQRELDEVNQREQEFYNTSRWRKLSSRVKEDSNYHCFICKELRQIGQIDSVHHLYPIRDRFELRYVYDNLVGLCDVHHRLTHYNKVRSPEEFNKLVNELKRNNTRKDY